MAARTATLWRLAQDWIDLETGALLCAAEDFACAGNGAAAVGGRWNSVGRSVIYLADSLALAQLEKRVHTPMRPPRDAGEHGALEAWERRATARAWADQQVEARLDEGGEPPAIGRVLDWHRGRGRRVISLLLDRTPPVVACVALPHDPDAPALVGVAAGRTLASAWRGAALELHQVHLTRCLGARTGDLRGRHGRLTAGRVMGVARDHAISRDALAALVAATRRSIAPGTVPSYAPHLDALAVDVTPPIAERLGRKVVGVVLGGE